MQSTGLEGPGQVQQGLARLDVAQLLPPEGFQPGPCSLPTLDPLAELARIVTFHTSYHTMC
jgi:hypothetical protein